MDYAKSISLPTKEAFRNLENAKRFAIDIGGTLAKLTYLAEVKKPAVRARCDSNEDSDAAYEVETVNESSERLHFVKFETQYIESCLDFITKECPALCNGASAHLEGQHLKATGGGSFKYRALLEEKLGVIVDKEDEMACLIQGSNFVLSQVPNESFIFERKADGSSHYHYQNNTGQNIFPYLLVNIGSGVSILKVDSATEYQRIGGTAMGGGTFLGLASLLTDAEGFDDLLQLAERGSCRNVDMLVSDIYGGEYAALGLPGDLTASCFGKCARSKHQKDGNDPKTFRQEDIVKSLLHLISNDIGQIAYLNARLHNLERIYFAGYFIRGHPVTMHTITYAINYWSKGAIQAVFLRHEGYLGAIGAFLAGTGNSSDESQTWVEHFSSNADSRKRTDSDAMACAVMEFERRKSKLQVLPLLKSGRDYRADLFDLTNDTDARGHWLQLMRDGTDKAAEHAAGSQLGVPDANQRALEFKSAFLARLDDLEERPNFYGSLSIRKLLDLRGECLLDAGFFDPYSKEKQQENEAALSQLRTQLASADTLSFKERQFALVRNLLAGNVFDWGSHAIVKLMESGSFQFDDSLHHVPARPWLEDGFDQWCARIEKQPYRSAVIFVDNSGFDIILGIFPFAIELLKQNTKVILAANSEPALNDVQHSELLLLAHRVGQVVPEVRTALLENRLVIAESGSTSPCIDLSRIDQKLCQICADVDLIILEGMGRALHTNYNAVFNCDCLKVAIIKNQWLAEKLGGEMFSAIFRFEQASARTDDTAGTPAGDDL